MQPKSWELSKIDMCDKKSTSYEMRIQVTSIGQRISTIGIFKA